MGLILILLLSLYGCAELLLAISRRVLSPPKEDRGVLMIPLCGPSDRYRICGALRCGQGTMGRRFSPGDAGGYRHGR